MTTDHHLRQLLEMLDHPEAYSEQEIRDIINNDDNSEAYRLLVDAKRSSRSRHAAEPIDVDAAWNDFEQKHLSHTGTTSNWFKTAASIIGILKNAFVLLKISAYWQSIVIGVVIVAAVTIDKLRSGMRKK